MVRLTSIVCATAAASLATAAASSPRHGKRWECNTKGVYFQTNLSPNTIAAIEVGSGGKLGKRSFHSTGGVGSAELTPTGLHLPDALGSANSVVVFQDYLFAVNAGSNSVSMFYIPPESPTALSLVGAYPVNGDFPNSIAVQQDTICVSYAGARSGVSCAKWCSTEVEGFDAIRPFEQQQQNPPNTSLALMSDVRFGRDGAALVVSSRGPSAAEPGLIVTYHVEGDGQVSSKASHSHTPEGTVASFGTVAVPDSSLILVADPTYGGYTLDLLHPKAPAHKYVVPGQKAICWAGISSDGKSGIFPDAGRNTIAQVDIQSGDIIQQWNSTNGNSGNFDFAVSGDDVLFALAFNPSDSNAWVASVYLGEKFADLDNVAVTGADNHAQGMAVYPTY